MDVKTSNVCGWSRLKKTAACLAAFVAVALATSAEAASIKPIPKWNGVSIQGGIVQGDLERFVETVITLDLRKTVTIVLNSHGGNFDTAANIVQLMGRASEEYGIAFNTYVGKTDECASACTYIWAMGKEKFVTFGGQLYVHAVISRNASVPGGPSFETETSEALTLRAARFYKATGAPDSVVAKALENNPAGNVIGYPEIGRWGGTFLSDVDGHRFKTCRASGPEKPLAVTCDD
ncbi:hypothetical protein [Bosea sp. NBC_00550]|uniref:hypothetical protein n=1 Tax=Bosea sp. NBC_00550 TaxID=2969621 RepID=UPI00222EF2C7|nr:hypothetical protein [Bosea sp. NBC_00550]UZF93024.1 hypothetical protein NWE53_02060 [Bosea sp. NBC_00550]